ncbi:MAG: sodium/proton antiporter NhaB [Rhodospirillaceae bacterium]
MAPPDNTHAPARRRAQFAVVNLFLGNAPDWYKAFIAAALVLNPLILMVAGPFVTGWVVLIQFIFTLALALKCYPLQPGGLLAIEAVVIGLASPQAVYEETQTNFPVILLLMFMVAGIYFLRDLLIYVFSKLLLGVRNKRVLSLLFCATAAVLSAFLDALTVIAVIITVVAALHGIYHCAVSDGHPDEVALREDLHQFRAFLSSIVMHAAVGTALGGVCTLVGEPQNLLIGHVAGWNFMTFFLKVAPVSIPVLAMGLTTCMIVEKARWFGYGEEMPASVRRILTAHQNEQGAAHDSRHTAKLVIQAAAAVFLVAGLALHIAEVGLIGLTVIVLATAFCGIVDEKRLGHAFEEAMPFVGLLVTFFAIVAIIQEQHLFRPIIDFVLAHEGREQLVLMYLANGALSAISDNVFVATVYITAAKDALDAGQIDARQFELLAVAINTGTNIPSVATPNGQAAFLFLLTSALSPMIRLGYMKMLWMALPYTLIMTITGLAAVSFLS